MTIKDIEKAAKSLIEQTSIFTIPENFSDVYLYGFYCGAMSVEKQKEQMIEKAAEWLSQQEEYIGVSFPKDFIDKFKKVMKEV